MKKLVILLTFLTSACVQQEIVDELLLIHATGIDYVDELNFRATVSVPIYKGDNGNNSGEGVTSETITAVGRTAKNIRAEMDSKSPKLINNSKLAVVLFNNEMAKKGIIEQGDTFYRDPLVGQRLYLGVFEGSTNQLLENQPSLQPEISKYLSELIEQNINNHNIPKSNMHVFVYRLYQEGMETYLPYLKKVNDQVQVTGVAIFKNDKMVSALSLEESIIFKMLIENFQGGTYEVALPDKEFASIRNLSAQSSYQVEMRKGMPEITLNLRTKGYVNEYSGIPLDQKKINEINHLLEEELTVEISKLIKKFQDLETDPVGLGFQVKTRTRGWDEQKWTDQYPNVKVHVNVDTIITHGGVSD
ncbi:Ger(x)C family spore germination protein [Salipaludibacillus sp. CUR1]|uniref:Ger(x)C family spore germination protein n=1 Tax=Salipaludibacillus sp. CUR1 TaxID=2820003 RepID=UPI001E302A87|nr:Ger(x)C family spore germination protein [Salipaludibacillus sp. CUR1]MCE7794447.1 Ger(x)C family spore germination protein [Salipaludibacillus sp. CUR1]